ncbi:MAG: septation protein IspZ [Gammaproteobacteria bacterium TMED92]|nr:MAG: septation protein IspZ [Gammaproteobacteria bacterium TMED92]
MQQLIDFAAVLAFLIAYFVGGDIFIATAVLMVSVSLQMIAYKLLRKPISNELKITFWASMLLGGLTLVVQDEAFIQWKPTVIYSLFAAALLGSFWFKKVFLLEKVLGKAMQLSDQNWQRLTYGWSLAFLGCAGLNIWVANNFSMDTWVTFKVFGLMALQLGFIVITVVYLAATGALSESSLNSLEKSEPQDS